MSRRRWRAAFIGIALALMLWLAGRPGGLIARVFADGGYFRDAANKHSNTATGVLRDAALPRGACNQCHIKHAAAPNDFLLFAAGNAVCLTCHNGTFGWERAWTGGPDFNASAHGTELALYNPASGAGTGRPVSRCIQCHNPHGRGDAVDGFYPSLNQHLEEKGCFSNNDAATPGSGCHGSNAVYRPGAAPDIYTELTTRINRHPVMVATKVHLSTEARVSGWNPAASRHAECVDCHNPHRAKAGRHTPPTAQLSNVLLGTWGVEPTWPAAWTDVTAYTVKDFADPPAVADKEYQLCLKCHSYFAYTATPPAGYTDQALQFNPNNPAYHNVGQAAARSAGMYAAPTTSFNRTAYLWHNDAQMYCSDCHAQQVNTASSTLALPQGPHGSDNNRLLRGVFDGSTGDKTIDTSSHLCFKCHDYTQYSSADNPAGTGFSTANFTGFDLHFTHVWRGKLTCQNCHVKIIHGWKHPHLLAYYPDQALYPAYYGVSLSTNAKATGKWIHPTTWSASGNWVESNCDNNHLGGGGQTACR